MSTSTRVASGRYIVDVTEAVPDGWDDLVAAAGAPVFYRADVLAALRRHPLRRTLATRYLAVRHRDEAGPALVCPAFLIPAEDPLGVLTRMLPRFEPGGRPLLLSHLWHWYDTRLPARELDAELFAAARGALGVLARERGAQAHGLMNVTEGGPLARAMAAAGLPATAVDARYILDLRPFPDADAYVAALPAKARQDVRRHLRIAGRSGAEVTAGPPTRAGMRRVAALCDLTAGKHNNAGWYDPAALVEFACALPHRVRLVTVTLAGTIVAASISLVDGPRFHNWAGGSVPPRELPFSPYLVLLHGTIGAAIGAGCLVLEAGRRNDAWKQRLGMTRRPLLGWADAG